LNTKASQPFKTSRTICLTCNIPEDVGLGWVWYKFPNLAWEVGTTQHWHFLSQSSGE